ncbi:MAG: OmpA family protein [Gammaproteobacteria bacterium]|nr:OmpA family protein [Gammaproteobacteria bacterium]
MKSLLLAACLSLFIGSATAAEDNRSDNNPRNGQFYVSPGVVVYEGPGSRRLGYEGHEAGLGLILGYSFSDHWSVEVLGGRVESDFNNTWGSGEDNIDLRWLNLLYKFKTGSETWQPFIVGGGGRGKLRFENVRSNSTDNQYNLGLGVFHPLSERFSIRADIRAVSSSQEAGFKPFAFVGLTGFLGDVAPAAPPADSDGDGVPNEIDQCPTTPAGRVVDASGCELDGDGDGVVDGDDQCLETPQGVAVDASGCALDSDGDGVPDYMDECPGSERGAKVDAKGCYIELEEEVTIDMSIEFDTNKAIIRADHGAELGRAVKFLREYPTAHAVIEGHTDSDGAASYNQGLSEQRAKAVYEYLINEANISQSRLAWAGFGETRPLASNDSAAGKQENRRVTAVVSGTHKVRQ